MKNLNDTYLANLNAKQKKAVLHATGPAVVFAGAGSGKTRVITTRIAHLIENGVKASKILAVTFTNRAAAEMRERIENLTPYAHASTIATFHAACARWLREFADELGFGADFLIYDDSDMKSALKKILKDTHSELDLSHLVDEMKQFIAQCKTRGWLPADIEKNQERYSHLIPAGGLAVYKKYQEVLAASNAMDFGDLMLNMILLLRQNEKVRHALQNRYEHLLVDEYQDTNPAQFELLNFLNQTHNNIFAVGDDDQSIYSWRGATPGNILDFEQHFPGAKKYTLEQNYRCKGVIINAANAMIRNNEKRVAKELWTENEAGPLIQYLIENDGELEAWSVVDTVHREAKTFSYENVAIFYRTNSQSRLLEDSLRREGIPYKIYGTTKFYDRMEIKDLVAYLRVLANLSDDVSLRRIINVPPRKLGKKTIDTMEDLASKNGTPLFLTIENAIKQKDKVALKFKDFVKKIHELREELKSIPLSELVELIIHETGYAEYIEQKFTEHYSDKLSNIHELVVAIEEYESREKDTSLNLWLQSMALNTGDEEAANGVSLMTLHMAKGLEFDRVHIVGVEDGLIPHSNNTDDKDLLEEERRLFYVGMTRTGRKLSLYGTYKRRTYTGWVSNMPSRFLMEVPKEFIEADFELLNNLYGRNREPDHYEADHESEVTQVRVGAQVHHPTYGRGTIQEIFTQLTDMKVLVDFSDYGLRKVAVRHLS